jgi:maltose/moltooligosaccharide transporter
MLMESIVPSILPLKLKHLGASNATIGLLLTTIPMVINTVLNPIVSFKSDRYRSRWGRRIPFMLFTIPPLVLSLVLMGFSSKISLVLHGMLDVLSSRFTPEQVTIGVIAVIMVFFSFFNSFICAVFWYLFKDVVPENLMARWMSWFRMVSMGAGAFYNFFIFQYAESHALEIFVGGGLLYLVGFGLVCWNVKEGNYPPPPANIDGKQGVWSGLKTYGIECHRYSHYIFIFLVGVCMSGVGLVASPFMLFFYQSCGLSLQQIGILQGTAMVVFSVCILGSGWLADRYHPIRIVMIGLLAQAVLVLPLQCLWLFWTPSPQVSFYLWVGMAVLLGAPSGALIGVLDPPLFMRLFPQDRFGQFCSANAMWRSAAAIVGGVVIGWYFDFLKQRVGEANSYLWLPVWQWVFTVLALMVMWKLYRSWQRYGGDESYMPPSPEREFFCNEPTDQQHGIYGEKK